MKKNLQNQTIDVQSRYSDSDIQFVSYDDEQDAISYILQETAKELMFKRQEGESF